MRVSCLILVLAAGLLGSAHAEKVRTNQTTKVYARAGEQATVILKVDSGQNMTLIEQEGRWLKVRVKGRTGFVPRSKVDMADDEDIQRNTRRRPFVDGRSKKRGWGQEEGPEDRVGADAVGEGQDDEPRAKKPKKGEDEEEDRSPKSKKVKKGEEEEKSKKVKKGEDEEKSKKVKKGEDEEEDRSPKAKKAKKGEDEEEDRSAKSKKGEDEEVDDSKAPEPEEDKRPTAHVSKKASVFDKPSSSSDEVFVVRPTDVLYPIEEKGRWTYVENSEGDSGWVQTDRLEAEEGGIGGKRPHMIDIGAGLGVMFITQQMRAAGSNVSTVPDNYNIPIQAVTLALRGSLIMPVSKQYLVGADASYDFANTLFGGVSYDPDAMGPMAPVVTKITMHTFNGRAVGGYDFGKFAVLGRLGVHYRAYLVGDYADPAKNPAQLPQETIIAPTLGVALALPKLSDKISLNVALDTILFGASVKQTAGLEDGSNPSVKAVDVGAGVTYRMNKTFSLQVLYDFRLTSIDFGAPLASSTRMHMGTDVQRTDVFHVLTVGVAKPF